MKLFYMPGACSLAPHIALREAGLPFALARVDYATRRTANGADFRDVNPKGYVPALLHDDGWLLTEVPVILQYIDALAPQAALLPRPGTCARYRALEWLNYVATELHKSCSPLFRPTTPAPFLVPGKAHLARRLTTVAAHLEGNDYLAGPAYSLADAYLYTVCRWLRDLDLPLSDWPPLARHARRVEARPSVGAALAAEGLIALD
ncbi:MAG: glutathione transferase GstA [Alphaproteobacteria bacterium]|nr:glutathione transferase GstA [Alphaproteobacteria bacterium]